MTEVAPSTSNWRSRSLPWRLIPPKRCLPPLEFSLGVNPSQAAKCRPDLKARGSTVSASVAAPIGPMPGTSASSRLTGMALCSATSLRSSSATRVELRDLRPEKGEHLPRRGGDGRIVPEALDQCGGMADPLGHHDAKLGRMPAQRIDQLRALLDQQLAQRQQHAVGLFLSGFDRHEAHARPRRRLADRLGILMVVLGSLDERLDILRRDQPHPVAKCSRRKTGRSCSSTPYRVKTCLDVSMALNLHDGRPSLLVF
jgi:hypothetical protein